jgi:L-iditol 2-dehydrogenase
MTQPNSAILTAFKKGHNVRLECVPRRELGPLDIRIRVTACGICGTDLHLNPDDADKDLPFGHEIAGTVIETEAKVHGLHVGQKVVLESATPCGRCDECRNAKQELCTDIQSFFFMDSFGFAQEMIAPAICAIPCEDLSPEVACMSEPLGVAIDLVRLADIQPSSNVLIMGPGPIALMALSLIRRMGARKVFISGFERNSARIAAARKIGVDGVFDPTKQPLSEADFGCKIDRVLVTTPPPTLADAMAVACKGGIISFIGIAFGEMASCNFDVNDFHFKKLQLRASFASPALYTPLALQYLREGIVDPEILISHRFPLAEMPEAMKTARDGSRAVKVIVTP